MVAGDVLGGPFGVVNLFAALELAEYVLLAKEKGGEALRRPIRDLALLIDPLLDPLECDQPVAKLKEPRPRLARRLRAVVSRSIECHRRRSYLAD